jgi:hypothetical protein
MGHLRDTKPSRRRADAQLFNMGQVIGTVRYGGERGIRTPGTGVSPYNGLANFACPDPVAWNQSLTLSIGAPVRAK